MNKETLEKYIAILKKGHTLKADKEDMLEVIASDEELGAYKDQVRKSLAQNEQFLLPENKVIAKIATIGEGEKILYWCPCEFADILAVVGASNFDGTKYTTKYVQKEDQISIFGKDIKKSIDNIKDNLNPVESVFYNTYIKTEHPIADNVFYTLYVKEIDGEQVIKCSRNTALSPRPIKRDEA
jgi:hypothetical protein